MIKVFKLEWDDEMGEGWMNIFNLERCLFSKEHTRKDLLKVKELLKHGVVLKYCCEIFKEQVDVSVLTQHDDNRWYVQEWNSEYGEFYEVVDPPISYCPFQRKSQWTGQCAKENCALWRSDTTYPYGGLCAILSIAINLHTGLFEIQHELLIKKNKVKKNDGSNPKRTS